jgi:hypothetical protein
MEEFLMSINNLNPFDFRHLFGNKFSDLDKPQDNQKDINDKLYTYTELGKRFSMFPVKSKSKEPVSKWAKRCIKKVPFNMDDYKDSDENLLNAGIACGPASGIVVLDIDDWSQFENWCKSKGLSNPIPETFTVQSGGKSQHYYFKYPEDGKEYHKREISGAKLIGIGGYVVAQSSIHKSGKPYIVIKDIPIAAAPQWMLDIMLRKISKKKNNVKTTVEMLLPAPVITPAAYNIQRGVLSAIIDVSQSRNSCELPTAQILQIYNLNAPEQERFDSDKSFGRLLAKTLIGYNLKFTKKKLSINGKTPQGVVLEQESFGLIKELLNRQ